MHFDPRSEPHHLRHNPYTALVAPRPIGWISSINRQGQVNLAPYSFFNLVSAYPPFVMFASAPRKDSQKNAEETGEFVVNVATYALKEVMNASSGAYASGISEPAQLGIAMQSSFQVQPPRVALTPIALECKYSKTIDLIAADGTRNPSQVVIGEVVHIYIDDQVIVDGMVDIKRIRPIARLGYMDYAVIDHFFTMPTPVLPEADSADTLKPGNSA